MTNIFIKNIYYMLAYVFQSLRQEQYRNIAGEEFENIHSLFAAILAKGLGCQLKQGLYGDVEAAYKNVLKKELLYFNQVDMVELRRIHWNRIAFRQNSSSYPLLLGICRLVAEGLLLTTEQGMLLYAGTESGIQPDQAYQIHGNRISVKSLNLNLPFKEITRQLNKIISSHFPRIISSC